MSGVLGFVRRSLRTKVVLEHTQEMVEEEVKLRGTALVFTVSGTQPRLTPGDVREGLLLDFPDLPHDAVQISLRHPGTFFARFAETRWFDLVAAQALFHFRDTPILIRRWSRLTFAAFRKYRYSVRLFIEQLAPQAWSVATVARALPGCLIHSVASESVRKDDLSYFVIEAWVDRLEDVPTEATMDIHEPMPCAEPLCHTRLPPGFITDGATASPLCDHLDRLRSVPPRMLSVTALVHLDSSTFIRPAPAPRNRWNSRDDDEFDDGDDETTLTEEQAHPWAHGVPDDVWHQRLEAASSGSASGQHRSRRSDGGRRRHLTPANFHLAPLHAPSSPAPTPATPTPGPHAAANPNGALDDCQVAVFLPLEVNTAAPVTQPMLPPVLSPSPKEQRGMGAAPAAFSVEAMQSSFCGLQVQIDQSVHTEQTEPQTTPAGSVAAETGADDDAPVLPAAGDETITLLDPSTGHGPQSAGTPNSALVTTPTPQPTVHDQGPAHIPVEDLLASIKQPITPGLAPVPDSVCTPPGPPRRNGVRGKGGASTATRRSHRVQDRKKEVTGSGGNTLKLARKLLISKRGPAIAERGEESDDDAMRQYESAFDTPLAREQLEAWSTLVKGATRRKGRAAAANNASPLVVPVQ